MVRSRFRSRCGSRLRRGAVAPAAIALVALAALVPSDARAGQPGSPEDFCLIGEHEVSINRFGRIRTGSVAVNRADGKPLKVGDYATVDDGCAVVGDEVELRRRAAVDEVFANAVDADPTAAIHGSVSAASYGPGGRLFDFAPLPPIQTGSQTIRLAPDAAQELPSGSYRAAVIGRRATLTLTGGLYEFDKVKLSQDAAIRVRGPVEVRIARTFRTGARSFIGPEPGSGVGAQDIRFQVAARRVVFGPRTRLIGEYYAPEGKVRLRDLLSLEGRIVGDRILTQPRCSASRCGNDKVNPGEECDGSDDAACPGRCKPDCTCGIMAPESALPPTCGDGVLNPPGEECDDGGTANGDGCSSTCKLEPGRFCTFFASAWGSPCRHGSAACLLEAGFEAAFPAGLAIGDPAGPDGPSGGSTALWSSAAMVEAFLPASGPAFYLTSDSVDAAATTAGVLAGELVATKLNLAIGDGAASEPGRLGDLVLLSCVAAPLQGRTVDELVALADAAVADASLPAGVTLGDLASALAVVNGNFADCRTSAGCLGLP